MTTLDAHLLALNMKTGGVVWDTTLEDFSKGYASTIAPLVVKDKVIVGVAGGEYGIRGFIDAYDAKTGARAWRFYTIPGPGEPGHDTWAGDSWQRGGASVWVTGAYDPEINLLYYGIGNPGPDYHSESRKGDNLYSDSLVALDADTGKLRWHYQFTPHDLHDWDATQVPILADLTIAGQPRKVVMLANRNGFFYTLDRTNGKLLVGKPYVVTSWAKEIGADGRPVILPGYNVRPLEISGAIGREQLKKLPGMTAARRRNLAVFQQLFGEDDRFITQRENGKSSSFSFTIILNPARNVNRDKVFAALKEANIGFRMITGGCFLKHDVIQYYDYDVVDGGTPNADLAHDRGFFVGNYPEDLTPQIHRLSQVLDQACR